MKNFRFHLKIPFSKHRLICQPGCCAQVRPPDHRHQCHHPRRPPLQCLRQAVGPKGHRKDLSPILLEIRTPLYNKEFYDDFFMISYNKSKTTEAF